MAHQDEPLAERVRSALPTGHVVREVAMFGGLAFMLDNVLVVSAGRQGELLVRIDPARHQELVTLPGARPADMGEGRSMGPGWITIGRAGLETDDLLRYWIGIALDWHSQLARKV